MKQRFVTNTAGSSLKNTVISVTMFIAVFCVFWLSISSVSERTSVQEKQTLEAAITRNIVHCYAIEGSYPNNLQYLRKNYGLIYDEDRFFVDYQTLGSNIMPDITIIDKGEK